MGYATRYEVEQALANALTDANPDLSNGSVQIATIGNSLSDTVTDDEINQYIRWGDEHIDGVISSEYRIPLKRVNKGTFKLSADATAGDTFLILEDASRFIAGDTIVIKQGAIRMENMVIPQENCVATISPAPPANFAQPPDTQRLCLWLPLSSSFDMNLAKVDRVRFPDPIPKISARLAAAYIYDRHFAAQVEGNESNFGKALRGQAYQLLNMIKSGATKLLISDANDFVGRRYYNHALDDVHSTKAEPNKQFLQES